MVILAEALSTEPVLNRNGKELYRAAVLSENSEKFKSIQNILQGKTISYFLELHKMLDSAIGCEEPLVIVTDWTDPCEVVGLQLESEQETREFPNLCFLALETNWQDLRRSGIEKIFAHELSHLWLHRMGYQPSLSQTNRFHTSTAITDPFLAFSEGFAEHLEIVSAELNEDNIDEALYDNGYDLGAWLCNRDSALRIHAAKNNRFLYLTATPEEEDFASYQQLHMAHITSSSFMPERLKNGLQAVSSEGLIAAFFYRMYRSTFLKENPAPVEILKKFGCTHEEISPSANLYLKILWAMTKIDWKSRSLFTNFVTSYLNCFENDRETVLNIFAEITNFVTVDSGAQQLFGNLYRVGRQGNPEKLVQLNKKAAEQKADWIADIKSGKRHLDDAVYKSIWIEADKEVMPVPWDSKHSAKLKIDINAATDVDFFALEELTFSQCRQLVHIREERNGFSDLEEFKEIVTQISYNAVK